MQARGGFNMYYSQLYGLKPADRIIEPIFQTGISKHHSIYLGVDRLGNEWVAENYKFKGVRLINANEFFRLGKSYSFQQFVGTDSERKEAVQRALKILGKPYDLINYNCEHYASYVQTGKSKSRQVENVKDFIGGVALVVCLFIGVAALTNEN